MPFSYIEHKGEKILFIDYSKCKTIDEMLKLLNDVRREYEKSNESFLVLNDFTGANPSNDFVEQAKKYKELFDDKTAKTAVIGIVGLKRLLLNGYNVFVTKKQVPFDTKEEALDYLVS
jgi:cytochrome oxidase Cu insertion factor (SCO1/SenC/PrrC family)